MAEEIKLQDIIEAITDFSHHVDEKFAKLDSDVAMIKATMVTKDYLDEKMSDLRGDLTILIRKEDNKVKKLVEILEKKKFLNEADRLEIFSMEPFAQMI